ncbi:MAG: magnesium transporter [Bdellovibrionota bacterium]
MHGTPPAKTAKSALEVVLDSAIDDRYLLKHICPLQSNERLIDGLRRIENPSALVSGRKNGTSSPSRGEVYYYYVVDDDGRLCGIIPHTEIVALSLRAIVDSDFDIKSITVQSLMKSHPLVRIQAPATMLDAYDAFMSNGFLAIPLVDPQGKMIGCVSREAYDAVKSDLLGDSERATDKIKAQLASTERELDAAHGIQPSLTREQSWRAELVQRSVGLSFNLCHSVITLVMLAYFEGLMQRIMILASLIPSFLASSESLGGQSNYLSLHRAEGRSRLSAFLRELGIASILALLCSLVIGVLVTCRHSIAAGICIFVSLFLAMLKTALLSHVLPEVLRKLKFEPSLVAGSVVLAIADIVTIGLVFGISSSVL